MKNFTKKLFSISLSLATLIGVTACKSSSNGVKIDFVYGGSTDYLATMKTLIDAYNEGQGKIDGITVRAQPNSAAGLGTQVDAALSDPNGADVVMLNDQFFKASAAKGAGLVDLKGLFSEELIADMYPTHLQRYYYDVNNNTSKTSDPLLGLPLNNDSTVLFYNKDALNSLNIKCISVSEDELAAFNNGGKDHNGKTKTEYGIPADFTVPAKGFYRENAYVYGNSFSAYSSGELMIFNDRIAMNWDEMDDIARLCTKSQNSKSSTQYGYYTEWWFNYGWSIGGDCIEDLTGDGDYAYSIADGNNNYIVESGTYTGKHTGTVYNKGETLDFKDVISANSSDVIGYYTDNKSGSGKGTEFYWTVNGSKGEVISDVIAAKESGVLGELPSTSYALTRYCEIASGGDTKGVMPTKKYVDDQGGAIRFFTNEYLAFCIEYTSNFKTVDRDAQFDWGIAPLPAYKEYVSEGSDEVKVAGKQANHSLGYCVSINARTKLKDEAVTFINWLVGDGQKILAENNVMTSRISQKDLLVEKFKYDNDYAYILSLDYSLAGDWWYMPDRAWISAWATALNSDVRNAKMTAEEFIYGYITDSNEALKNYKK